MERRKIYQSIAAAGALAIVLTATSALAQGRINITPYIGVGVEYDSNFYRTEDKKAAVTTLNISPGIRAVYKTAKTKLTVDGTLERHDYDSSDDPPYGGGSVSDYSYTGGKVNLDLTSQITDRLTVGVQNGLRVTRDPDYIDAYSNDVGRGKYTTNTFSPNIYYDFGNKFGVGARYQNGLIRWSENGGEDYSENRGVFNLFYNLNRSTAAYLEYQIWQGSYDGRSSDYLANQVTLNAAKQINYFTFTAGAGYYSRSFDESGLSSINGMTWKVLVDGRDRGEDEDRKPRSFVHLGLIHDLNSYGSGDSYYAATRLELRGGYMFWSKLGISGMAMYQNSDYQLNPSDRTDDLYVLSAQVGYEIIDNLMADVEGGYRNRNSDAAGQSYDDTFIMAKLQYAYSFGHE